MAFIQSNKCKYSYNTIVINFYLMERVSGIAAPVFEQRALGYE